MTADPLVDAAWLAAHLNDPGVVVVDATWFMPDDGRSGREEYLEAHIPGAVFFDIDAISDQSVDLPHMLPTAEAFARAAGALGLRREADIVVYDGQGIFSAPRVWWTLRVMGYPRVRVLDGGLKAWRAAGGTVEGGEVSPAAAQVDPRFEHELVCDLEAVRRRLSSADGQVVDARAAPRFRGEVPEPRVGLRSGHMPGALNLPWGGLVAEGGTLRPAQELRAAFQAAGVDLARPIVTTCGSGVSAAILALALARIGRQDVAIYDGSWAEWGGRDDTAIATGA